MTSPYLAVAAFSVVVMIFPGCRKHHPENVSKGETQERAERLPMARYPIPTRSSSGSVANVSGWDVVIGKAGAARCIRSSDKQGNVLYSYSLPGGEKLELGLRKDSEQAQVLHRKQGNLIRQSGVSELLNAGGLVDPIVLNLLRYNMPWEDIRRILGPGGTEGGSGTSFWTWRMSDNTPLTVHLGFKDAGNEKDSVYVEMGPHVIDILDLGTCFERKD